MAPYGAVTASSAAAAAAGEEILRAGGNAVDASVAVALASCVADPCNTGIGGYGGHMMVAGPGLVPTCVDFNLWVPAGALPGYRSDAASGPAASAIPNVVAGLAAALKTFGSMTWADVLAPAIALAGDGFISHSTLARAFQDVKGKSFVDDCFHFDNIEAAGGTTVRIKQPALARTLRQLAAEGPQWFYHGPIAQVGSRCLSDAGHDITPDHWAEALEAGSVAAAPSLRIGDVRLSSAPLGTSGSICMFAAAVAGAELAADGGLESPARIGAWAARIASAWTYRFGTPDGNDIANDGILDWMHRAAACPPAAARRNRQAHTCHLNVADAQGMVVAATLTHGKLWFGARWALPGTGIVMNFGGPMVREPEPKLANGRAYGITNMSPTIAETGDGAVLAIGTPGARRIPTIVGLVLARHLFAGVPLQQAISLGRFHSEGRTEATWEKNRLSAHVEKALRATFATVTEEKAAGYYGPCTAIRRDADGRYTLGLDDRWQGYGTVVV